MTDSDWNLFDTLDSEPYSSPCLSSSDLASSDLAAGDFASGDDSESSGYGSPCKHGRVTELSGALLCLDCGEEIEKKISQDKEWRFYGQSDTKHSSDPNRCQMRKIEEKSIFRDVETLGFNEKIVSTANKIYLQVTGGKIHRGNSRKAIIFACVFHAFKIIKKPQPCENLMTIFNLDRKTGLRGLKFVNLNIPKESIINSSHITPANLVEDIMNKFYATDDQKAEVIALYHLIRNKSSKINRSRPQSIAAALIYFWILENKKKITTKEFVEKVGLSELTVTRLAKEIETIVKCQ